MGQKFGKNAAKGKKRCENGDMCTHCGKEKQEPKEDT